MALLKREYSVGSSPTKGTKEFADVMELVYISDLKSEFCGFESHLPHQVYTAIVQWIGQHSSKVRMRVRFLLAVPMLGLVA